MIKTAFYKVILFIAGVFIIPVISGQSIPEDLDSVVFISVNNRNQYKFFNGGEKEIKLSWKQPKLAKDKANLILRDIGNGALTVFTGIGFGSSSDVNWIFTGTISCNDMLPDWDVNLFCEGSLTTERERVRDDDGYWSVETGETRLYYWDKDAAGAIIEGSDTIGFFMIIMDPRENTLLKSLSDYIFKPDQVQKNIRTKNMLDILRTSSQGTSYGITGIFRDKNFSIISNKVDHKTWMFQDDVFIFMFQSEADVPRRSMKTGVMPYLLVNNQISDTERLDLFRLAMLNRFLNHSLNQQ